MELSENNLKAAIISLRFELNYRTYQQDWKKVELLKEHLAKFKIVYSENYVENVR